MSRHGKGLSPDDMETWESYIRDFPGSNPVRVPRYIYPDDRQPTLLDLHGLTLHAAWAVFGSFVSAHLLKGTKEVTVVTGGSGRMREEFRHWCDGMPGVASCGEIRSASGKVGSFRVRLRRS